MSEVNQGAGNVDAADLGERRRGESKPIEAMLDDATTSATGVDEFLTGYIVLPGLCLNFDVTERLRLDGALQVCAGVLCPQRRLCLSRSLRRHLDEVPSNPWLRRVFDEALLEMGNSQ